LVIHFRRGAPMSAAAMVSYMPPGDSTVLFLDVEALRDSGILEKLVGSTVAEEPEYKTFVAESGFDYRTDLDAVLSSNSAVQQLFLLKGRFDWKSLIKYAGKHGGSCVNGFCKVPSERPDRSISFYPVSTNVLALGISRDEFSAGNIHPPKRKAPVAAVAPQPVWLSVPASTLQDVEKLPPGTRLFAKALTGAENVVFALGPQDERFELAMDVTCKTAEDAVRLRVELEGLTTMLGKLISREKQTPNPSDLSGVLTAGVFQRVDRHVVGKWPIQKSFLDGLGAGGG
ncbi:MAG: hypothetical protein ABI822_29205, partial [Bryobacteraceae bacterium]